jgi:hypothetical protein
LGKPSSSNSHFEIKGEGFDFQSIHVKCVTPEL